ncbi:MAG: putative DCC family thiol-disulfide oxidoreductase YuxK [Verrucomicrobiales bacterium]
MTTAKGRKVVFVDGTCVLCHGLVKFLLGIDKKKMLTFSTLQGETAERLLAGTLYDEQRQRLAGVIYVRDCEGADQHVYTHSTAALLALRDIGGFWWVLSWLILIPRPLRNIVYDFIARNRYRWFGKHEEACPLPSQEELERFVP